MKRVESPKMEKFSAFLVAHLAIAHWVAMRVTRHRQRAEDARQQASFDVWKAVESGRSISNLRGLYLVAVHNAALEVVRIHKRQPRHFSDYLVQDQPESRPNINDDFTRREIPALVEAALQELCDDDRQVFDSHHFQGLTHQEVGDLIGKTQGAASMHYSRVIKKLREKLDPEPQDQQS